MECGGPQARLPVQGKLTQNPQAGIFSAPNVTV
jgi:hypothetical protein